MEIEAKLRVPNAEVLDQLRRIERLGKFVLGPSQVKEVHDTYLDTSDRLILAAGYICRKRVLLDSVIVTVKSLAKSGGAIHRREELEISLPSFRPVQEWPAGAVRDKVLDIIGQDHLEPLFDLYQTREVRPLMAGNRQVAEMSLDHVHMVIDNKKQTYCEVEVELKPDGREEELVSVTSLLKNEWGLQAESRSKFERALVLISDVSSGGQLMKPAERTVCQQLAERDDLHGRRAVALLALDDGLLQAEVGERAGMSERRVRYWLSEFRKNRLGVFPDKVLKSIPVSWETDNDGDGGSPALKPAGRQAPQPWTLDMLFERYDIDRTHARVVASFALALFDHLDWAHKLPTNWRRLTEIAALLHDVGVGTDMNRHDEAGKDILLQHPPAGLSEQAQQVIAITTLLHRRPISGKALGKLKKKVLGGLTDDVQTNILMVAALVRIADGLDYSEGGGELGRMHQLEGIEHIEIRGPFSSVDAAQAKQKADLWSLLSDVRLQFDPIEDSVPASKKMGAKPAATAPAIPVEEAAGQRAEKEPKSVAGPCGPGLEPDDTMAEAGRKTLLFHFERMLAHEAGTRLGEDVEELHDMRVATRRMRASLPVFGDYLDLKKMKPFVKALKRTGRSLGGVRDLDVFAEKTNKYLKGLPQERINELDPLMRVWASQRELSRKVMLAYLDSDDYANFVEKFGDFLHTPLAGALPAGWQSTGPVAYAVRHVVPIAIYRRLADVRAYDEWMMEPNVPLERYHQLRIASKGLRYTLEYFREVLGPEAKSVIDDVKALQDNLGDLQDAVVACNLLRDFLTWGTWGHSTEKMPGQEDLIVAPGVAAYLAARQSELQSLLDQFPSVWTRIHTRAFSEAVTAAISVL